MSLVFAGFGDLGSVMVMILSLVAGIIIGLYVLSYAAHGLITVVEGTGAGNDAIVWPDIPVPDWIGRGIYLGALLMIWTGPAAMLSRALSDDWLIGNDGMRFFLIAVPALWLLFPISLLSSMSASSHWFVFRSSIVAVMLRVWPATFLFYLFTALLAAGMAFVWYLAICGQVIALLFLAGPLGAACFLIYARLLGRLSERIHRLNPETDKFKDKTGKKKKRRRTDEGKPLSSPSEPVNGWDPFEERAIEPEEEEPELLEVADKEETEEAEPEPEPKKPPEEDDEFPLQPLERDEEYDQRWAKQLDDGPSDPYEMSSEPAAKTPEYRQLEEYDVDEMGPKIPPERRTGDGIVTHLSKASRQPRQRRKRPTPIPPTASWWRGVYVFPFYPTTVGTWLWLSIGFIAFGLCCVLILMNIPK